MDKNITERGSLTIGLDLGDKHTVWVWLLHIFSGKDALLRG